MKLLKDLPESLKPKAEYKLLINGKFVDGKSKKTFKSTNPATGEVLTTFAEADKEDVDLAVKSAHAAQKTWGKTSVGERSALLLKIADKLEAELERFATLETLDNGKPIRETLGVDVPFAVDHFRYFAGVIRGKSDEADKINEEVISIVLSEPIGVVGQIIPWNFPFLMAAWKIAPALAAGNSIVIKPSKETSLSIAEFGRILNEVLPAGVVNILTGAGSTTGDFMLKHEGFNKLAFTGSTEVGLVVAKAAADKLIPATLELGGKSANIIFDDANIEQAIEGVCLGILFNQGQVCCAGSRLLLHKPIYDKFLKLLKAKFESVKVGDPLDPKTQMGAQIDEKQLNKILKYIEIGVKEDGGKIVTGGKRASDKGAFLCPTIIEGVTNKSRVAQEEIFGPVLVVIPFKDEQEAIDIANDSEFGLGGAVWTQNLSRAFNVAKGVETGRVWVNTYNQIPAHSPFGGYKKSGIGRETHKLILEAYTQKKNIYINLSNKGFGLY
ncbi:MAG: aldehyde dehydrogenase family protein [Campylobacteraceae bacterium]